MRKFKLYFKTKTPLKIAALVLLIFIAAPLLQTSIELLSGKCKRPALCFLSNIVNPTIKASCLIRGGRIYETINPWVMSGSPNGIVQCVGVGKVCEGSRDCPSGVCVWYDTSNEAATKAGKKVAGNCSKEPSIINGCYYEVQDGQLSPEGICAVY